MSTINCMVIVPYPFCMLEDGRLGKTMLVRKGIHASRLTSEYTVTMPATSIEETPLTIRWLHYHLDGLRELGLTVIVEPFAITLLQAVWQANGWRDEETINEIMGGDL